ncbi:hypothetical protein HHK36_011121 [Tetracentron sinense]|uniref:MLO-like protein n=1 Tax=Tetracentron sinense TaxID=13715 RepID=A0A834ZFM2_TETSI|nr:hypothetical protein HHK36_011121 [Tetracentron sinense]
MAAGATSTRSLQETPVWALATVLFFFIAISIFLEHSIHLITSWLKRHRKTALSDAVEKLKSELMLLGFMSLLLAATQRLISNICISSKVADTMLPCRDRTPTKTGKLAEYEHLTSLTLRKLFPIDGAYEDSPWHPIRLLATDDDTSDKCGQGKVPLVSPDGIHQLHTFIFVLAVMQIIYSVLTMALGRAKMRRWKAWEKETQTTEYQVANDPNRFRFTRQTTFGRRHMNSCTETTVLLWIKCFFRQFFNSVAKVDYLTLRHGFISAHLSTNIPFNFQKYIRRSLENDFKAVVGISPLMWFIVVIFMLVDVHGWHVYLWVSFLPLIIVLVLGTKLEVIVARMALQLKNQNSVIKGAPLVQPNDKLFWFSHPNFVLNLIHLTLFMNAFEIAFFIWVTLQFGLHSCYHEKIEVIITRVVLAVTVQVLCSYITLPLYALVTQMGSQFKSTVLKERTAKVIKQWHAEVRENRKKQQQSARTSFSKEWSTRMASPTEDSSLLQQPTRSSFSKEWGIRKNSPTEDSSLRPPRPTPTLIEITPFPSRDEITEERQEIIREQPNSASVPSGGVQLELQMVNKTQNSEHSLRVIWLINGAKVSCKMRYGN